MLFRRNEQGRLRLRPTVALQLNEFLQIRVQGNDFPAGSLRVEPSRKGVEEKWH